MRRRITPLLFLVLFASCNKATDATSANNILTFKVDGDLYSMTPTTKKTDSAGQSIITINGGDPSGLYLTIRLFNLYKQAGIFTIGDLIQSGSVVTGTTMVLEYRPNTGVGRIYSSSAVPGGKSVGPFTIRLGLDTELKAEFNALLPIVSGSGVDTTRISEGNVEVTF